MTQNAFVEGGLVKAVGADVVAIGAVGAFASGAVAYPANMVQLVADTVQMGWIEQSDGSFAAPAMPAAPSFAALSQSLRIAASTACDAVTKQIVPDATHQNSYVLAYGLVGPNATVPTADPAKTTFANLAASNGMQPQQFATLVAGVALASMSLTAILGTLNSAAAAAKVATDLAAALTAFETGITAFVTALNADGLTVIVQAPPAITIVGINA